jgi:hypothetical protein
MKPKGKLPFDPKMFLAKVGKGKTISKYRTDQIVFSQGDLANAVFYIQQGKVKLSVLSEQGKEAVVAILGPGPARNPMHPRSLVYQGTEPERSLRITETEHSGSSSQRPLGHSRVAFLAGTRPAEWAWDSRSAVRSSKLTADDYRPQAMLGRVRRFNSPCRRRDKLRADIRINGSNLSDLGR